MAVWYKWITGISVLLLSSVAVAQSAGSFIRSGNKAFEKGAFDKAMEAYQKALDKESANPKAEFNMGAAAYEKQQFDKAEQQFRQSLEHLNDPGSRSNAWYNTGNSLYRQDKLEESIEAYKQALRENPGNEDARYNMLMARKKLEQQQQQQQQNNQRNGQPPPPQDDREEDKQDGQQQNGGQNKDKQEQQPQPDISDDQKLRQLLQAIDQEESRVQQKMFGNDKQRPSRRTEKDW